MLASAASHGLTIRALAVGSLVGSVMCVCNTFFGLSSGWITLASMPCAVLGYCVCALAEGVRARVGVLMGFRGRGLAMDDAASPSVSVHENVIIQTVAVAINSMPLAAGFVGVVPALAMLGGEGAGAGNAGEGRALVLSIPAQCAWALALAYFGVFTAAPLRKRAIIVDKLPFPSGTATAHIIAALHRVKVVQRMDVTSAETCARDSSAQTVAFASPSTSRGSDIERLPLVDHAPLDDAGADASAARTLNGAEYTAASAAATSLPESDEAGLALELERANAEGDTDMHARLWRALGWCFTGSAFFTLLAYFVPVMSAIPIFSATTVLAGATSWGWTLSLSPSGMGQGMIMGTKTCVNMLAGAALGWGVLAPVSQAYGWAPGAPMDWRTGGRGFILWIALAIMLVDSSIGLSDIAITWVVGMCQQRRGASIAGSSHAVSEQGAEGHATPASQEGASASPRVVTEVDFPESLQVPASVSFIGMIVSTILAIVLLVPITNTVWYEPLAAVILSLPVSAIAVRAMGETDMNPASGISKLSQAVFGLIAPGNIVSNLVAGAVAEAGAMQAGDLMHDYRVGYMLGVAPRAQFIAQLLGATIGVFTTVGAYNLYAGAFGVPSATLPAPTAGVWIAMARLVNGGALPPNCVPFCLSFAALVLLIHIVRAIALRAKRQERALSPAMQYASAAAASVSPIALAIGMYVAPSWSIPRVIGALASMAWARRAYRSHAALHIMVATGLLLGEGLVSMATAALASSHVHPATCIGCAVGQCGSFCP